jgi:hypothetical protein
MDGKHSPDGCPAYLINNWLSDFRPLGDGAAEPDPLSMAIPMVVDDIPSPSEEQEYEYAQDFLQQDMGDQDIEGGMPEDADSESLILIMTILMMTIDIKHALASQHPEDLGTMRSDGVNIFPPHEVRIRHLREELRNEIQYGSERIKALREIEALQTEALSKIEDMMARIRQRVRRIE